MANLTAAIRQVQRARQRLDAPKSENFDSYQPGYTDILSATADFAGEPTSNELKQWMIESTKKQRRLQTPTEVRN